MMVLVPGPNTENNFLGILRYILDLSFVVVNLICHLSLRNRLVGNFSSFPSKRYFHF